MHRSLDHRAQRLFAAHDPHPDASPLHRSIEQLPGEEPTRYAEEYHDELVELSALALVDRHRVHRHVVFELREWVSPHATAIEGDPKSLVVFDRQADITVEQVVAVVVAGDHDRPAWVSLPFPAKASEAVIE